MNEIGAFYLDDIDDDGKLIVPKEEDEGEAESKPIKKNITRPSAKPTANKVA